MKGSMNMSYDSANLTTPDIKWLGVRPSDLNRFNIPKQCRIKMTDEDIKTGKKMVRRACLQCSSRTGSSTSRLFTQMLITGADVGPIRALLYASFYDLLHTLARFLECLFYFLCTEVTCRHKRRL